MMTWKTMTAQRDGNWCRKGWQAKWTTRNKLFIWKQLQEQAGLKDPTIKDEVLGENRSGEEPGWESAHSAQILQVPQMTHLSINWERRKRIEWPAANRASRWNQLDNDLDQILVTLAGGGVDRKLCHQPKSTQAWPSYPEEERIWKWAAFIAKPYKFTKKLVGQNSSGSLVCWWEEIN